MSLSRPPGLARADSEAEAAAAAALAAAPVRAATALPLAPAAAEAEPYAASPQLVVLNPLQQAQKGAAVAAAAGAAHPPPPPPPPHAAHASPSHPPLYAHAQVPAAKHAADSVARSARARRTALMKAGVAGGGDGAFAVAGGGLRHIMSARSLRAASVVDSCLRGPAPARPAASTATSLPARTGVELASVILQVRPSARDARRDATELEYQRLVIAPCLAAGLEVRSFYGVPDLNARRTIFIQVWASTPRLLEEAARIKMALLLDAYELAAADARANRLEAARNASGASAVSLHAAAAADAAAAAAAAAGEAAAAARSGTRTCSSRRCRRGCARAAACMARRWTHTCAFMRRMWQVRTSGCTPNARRRTAS